MSNIKHQAAARERPILFSGPMVRALLSGQKTQTRRVVKGQALDWLEDAGFTPAFVADPANSLCPYGQIGDRLWVRETFVTGFDLDDNGQAVGDQKVWYRATDARLSWYDNDGETTMDNPPWKPSIHMPRWASRLTLQITDIRVERLQAINQADAEAEGIACTDYDNPDAVEAYRQLWEHINGPNSWAANPWVWVITFEVIS